MAIGLCTQGFLPNAHLANSWNIVSGTWSFNGVDQMSTSSADALAVLGMAPTYPALVSILKRLLVSHKTSDSDASARPFIRIGCDIDGNGGYDLTKINTTGPLSGYHWWSLDGACFDVAASAIVNYRNFELDENGLYTPMQGFYTGPAQLTRSLLPDWRIAFGTTSAHSGSAKFSLSHASVWPDTGAVNCNTFSNNTPKTGPRGCLWGTQFFDWEVDIAGFANGLDASLDHTCAGWETANDTYLCTPQSLPSGGPIWRTTKTLNLTICPWNGGASYTKQFIVSVQGSILPSGYYSEITATVTDSGFASYNYGTWSSGALTINGTDCFTAFSGLTMTRPAGSYNFAHSVQGADASAATLTLTPVAVTPPC